MECKDILNLIAIIVIPIAAVYTYKTFRQKIVDAGMAQSMSSVGRCIDNGPMEGFWGIMKREMYYGRKYKTKEALISAI